MNYNLRESINANSILSKIEAIVSKTKIKHPKAEIIELDGTKYIYYSYFDRGFDDDGLDMVWDKCSDLKGVVDVGFGYGYGLENTKYENSLLIELDDDVIVESKKSARKSIKESADDINNTAYFDRVAGELHSWYVCYVEDYERKYEYGFKNEKECINWIKKNGFDLDPSMIESKKSARTSLKESADDILTVKEFCFWGHSGNIVEIWTIDGVLCDTFEVRNVGKSEYKNYEIHGWDCAKNTVIIYIKK